MKIVTKQEKDVNMQDGPPVLDVSDSYPRCVDCRHVLVPKLYRSFDYVPLCASCRKKRRLCRE